MADTQLTQKYLDSLVSRTYSVGAINSIGQAVIGYFNSRTQNKVAKWQAVIAEENQRMANLAAEDSLMQSQYKIGQISMQAQKLKSNQRAAMAANGIVLGEGSSAEILTTTDVLEQESINVERLNGYRQAWGFRTQGVNYAGQALAAEASKSNPFTAGAVGLLSGAADTAYSASKAGMLKKFLGK